VTASLPAGPTAAGRPTPLVAGGRPPGSPPAAQAPSARRPSPARQPRVWGGVLVQCRRLGAAGLPASVAPAGYPPPPS
jgi:hypothetical protein